VAPSDGFSFENVKKTTYQDEKQQLEWEDKLLIVFNDITFNQSKRQHIQMKINNSIEKIRCWLLFVISHSVSKRQHIKMKYNDWIEKISCWLFLWYHIQYQKDNTSWWKQQLDWEDKLLIVFYDIESKLMKNKGLFKWISQLKNNSDGLISKIDTLEKNIFLWKFWICEHSKTVSVLEIVICSFHISKMGNWITTKFCRFSTKKSEEMSEEERKKLMFNIKIEVFWHLKFKLQQNL